MPHDIRVITAREFLRADVHGRLDLPASKRVLEQLAAACAGTPDRHILIDVRDTKPANVGSVEVYELVQTLRVLGLGVLNQIAVLRCQPEGFDRGRLFEMLATDRGFQVGVFEDFEAAFAWLYGKGEAVPPAGGPAAAGDRPLPPERGR
jgi:hypothetical protein